MKCRGEGFFQHVGLKSIGASSLTPSSTQPGESPGPGIPWTASPSPSDSAADVLKVMEERD